MAQRTAQCTCGQLTITVTGEPAMVAMCNCLDCQRRSGSQFGSGAFFERPNVAIAGDYKSFSRVADSGKNLTNHFCPNCGSNIAWEAEIRPDWIAVAVGAFADPNFPPPTVVLYDRTRHPWITPPASARVVPPGTRPPR